MTRHLGRKFAKNVSHLLGLTRPDRSAPGRRHQIFLGRPGTCTPISEGSLHCPLVPGERLMPCQACCLRLERRYHNKINGCAKKNIFPAGVKIVPSCNFKLWNLHLTAGTISGPARGRLDRERDHSRGRTERHTGSSLHSPKSKITGKEALRREEGGKRPQRWATGRLVTSFCSQRKG